MAVKWEQVKGGLWKISKVSPSRHTLKDSIESAKADIALKASRKKTIKMAIKDKVVGQFRHLAHKDVGELVSLGADILKHVMEFKKTPGYVSGAKFVFDVWKVLDSSKGYAEEYFSKDYSFPYDRQFGQFVVDSVDKFPYRVIKTADDDTLVKIANVYGEEVGWTYSTSDNTVQNGVYVKDSRLEESKAALKKALWERVSHRSIVMEKMPPKGENKYSEGINFKKDDDLVGLRSQKADEWSAYLKRFMDKGIPRTVLLHGRPGTGKSTIAQAVADNLQLKTLRIRVEDIADFDNNVIFEAINLFEPDAVILDDLDRSMAQSHLLETMTRFHKHVKLVFATVNYRDALDEALQRPGRFDQIERVKSLDDEVILKMLGPGNEDLLETMKDWPIAFIEEYAIRRQVMSKEEAVSSIKELSKRVARLSDDDDDTEDEVPEDDDSKSDEEETDSTSGMDAVDTEDEMSALVDELASKIDEVPQPDDLEIPPVVKRYLKQIKKRIPRNA